MRATRLSSALLGLGVIVGAAAGIGLLVGFEPADLPRALLNVAAYKLAFLAAGGLIAAGAIARRYGDHEESEKTRGESGERAKALVEGLSPDVPRDSTREESIGLSRDDQD